MNHRREPIRVLHVDDEPDFGELVASFLTREVDRFEVDTEQSAEAERATILDPGYTTSESGTGFGLSIVRDVAQAHGWSLEVTEADGGGARFEFTGIDPVG